MMKITHPTNWKKFSHFKQKKPCPEDTASIYPLKRGFMFVFQRLNNLSCLVSGGRDYLIDFEGGITLIELALAGHTG
jgi:hypothetical protein